MKFGCRQTYVFDTPKKLDPSKGRLFIRGLGRSWPKAHGSVVGTMREGKVVGVYPRHPPVSELQEAAACGLWVPEGTAGIGVPAVVYYEFCGEQAPDRALAGNELLVRGQGSPRIVLCWYRP